MDKPRIGDGPVTLAHVAERAGGLPDDGVARV